MAVADFLKEIGSGVAKGAKVVGDVAKPVLARTAEVVSGEAPEIDAEKRRQTEKLEDEQIAAKASVLEKNLEMGQRYGTLTPEDQQKYVDAITGLYSHPRHAPTLMEKLRKTIHPNGAYAAAPEAPLPNATPAGGTFQQEENAKAKAEAEKLKDQEALAAYKNGLPRKSTGKSPPLTGDKLPPDAVGADGNPISDTERNAGKSFVEFNGAWWPVAKPKPVFKTVKGHSVLVDGQSGAILRDLGPVGSAKVTTRQTLQPGDDGQMHLVNLTSVTTPEGASIEVQAEGEQPSGGAAEPAAKPAASAPAAGGAGAKPPVKKVTPGSILPKTGAKPAGSPSAGPVVPGLTTLAKSKNPVFKSDVAQYTKASEDARGKKLAYENAKGLLADDTRETDLELVYAWVRSNVQGAGRMTNTEIKQTGEAGSWGTRIQNAISQASTGRLAEPLEKQFFQDIERSYKNAQKEADDLKTSLGTPPEAAAPAAGGMTDDEFLMKLGRPANGPK